MGILSGIADIVNSGTQAAALAYDITKDQALTGAQREANEYSSAEAEKARIFNASEAEKARQFNSSEADLARKWQEEQYLKYNSPAAQMRQMADAGLNPSLMYGGSVTPASASSSAASGSAASSGSSPTSTSPSYIGSLFQNMLQLSMVGAQIENLKANTKKTNAEAEGTEIDNKFKPELLETQIKSGTVNIDLMNAGISKVTQEISNMQTENKYREMSIYQLEAEIERCKKSSELISEQTATEIAKRSLMFVQGKLSEVQSTSVSLDNVKKEWENHFRDMTGTSPDEPAWNAIVSLLGSGSMKISDGISNLTSKIRGLFK